MTQIELDNRGLSPPEPMVRILSAISGMAEDGEMVALMDREPLLLYPELQRRGFGWQISEASGHYVLTIRRENGG